MNFLKRENPKTILEGLDRALEMLEERYKKKEITIETYKKLALDYQHQREKYQKKVGKLEP